MLSRRIVRVRAMQLLYAINRDKKLSFEEASKSYNSWVDNSFEAFLYTLYLFTQVTEQAVDDFKQRKGKHLPTDLDKAFSAKIHENDIISYLVNNEDLQKSFKKYNFESKTNPDYIRQIYDSYSKTEDYLKYILNTSEKEDHLEALLSLFRYCKKDEYFFELMEDNYPFWIDGKSLIIGAFKRYIKMLPNEKSELHMIVYPDKETTYDFGKELFIEAFNHDEELLSLIVPVIQNWDQDRVAVIDMIMLKLALTELLYFKTIPTKVTINEYLELSKMYSTPKSKEFINGVLDKLMQELSEDNRIEKEGRGLHD